MATFKQTLASGPAVVMHLPLPPGIAVLDYINRAEQIKTRVSAFLVGDNPGASPGLSSLAAARLLADAGLEPILVLSCRDRNRLALSSDLLGAKALGLPNVMAVSGDHPALGPVPQARPVFDFDSLGLIEAMKGMNQGQGLTREALAEPASFHIGAVVNVEAEPLPPQLAKFWLKAAAGAEYFFSQAVFHPEKFTVVYEEAKKIGVKLLACLRIFTTHEVPDLLAGRKAGLYLPADLEEALQSSPEQAYELSLAAAKKVAAALKGRSDGFVVMAPDAPERAAEIIGELELG